MKNIAARFICIALLTFIVLSPLWGQLERDSVTIILDEQGLGVVRVADLDGDGDDDILGSRNARDGHLAFFENLDGQGTLGWPVVFGDSSWSEVNSRPYYFELGDMDNDGDLDIVDGLSVRQPYPYLENNGSAVFSSIGSPLPPEDWVKDYDAFRVVDMNEDGWLDILFYNTSSRRLYVNWNQGAGQAFQFGEIYFLGYHHLNKFAELEVSDYDQDGDLDILIFSTIQYNPVDAPFKSLVLEFIESENGIYQHSTSNDLQLEINEGNVTYDIDASLADMDADGTPDLVYCHQPFHGWPSEEDLVIWRNEGMGSFSFHDRLSGYQSHILQDLNQDGLPDIVALREIAQLGLDEHLYEWLENQGSLSFEPHLIDSLYTGQSIKPGDFNNDGKTDLLSYGLLGSVSYSLDHDASVLYVRYAQGGSVSFATPSALTKAFGYIRDIAIQDVNLDGQKDILVAVSNGVRWIENLGAGEVFSPPATLWDVSTTVGDFRFTNLNDDAFIDGVGTLKQYNGQNAVAVWTGSDTALVLANVELSHIDKFALGKLDADTDIDILTVNAAGECSILWNELVSGDTIIAEAVNLTPVATSAEIRNIGLADLNLDGMNDLLLSTEDEVYYAINLDNSGTFDDWELGFELKTSSRFFVGDYNADGLADIRMRVITGNEGFMTMITYDTSSQAFRSPRIIGNIGRYFGLDEVPLNDDLKPDFLDGEGFSLNMSDSEYLTEPYVPSPFTDRLHPLLYHNAIRADLNNDGSAELVTGPFGVAAYDLGFLNETTVEGLIYWDTTGNCTFDSIYPPLPNAQLTLNSGINYQHTTTTPDGHYGFYMPDAPQHILTAVPMSEYWEVCPADTTLDNNGPHVVHFAASANVDCPLMELDLALSSIPQCFPSTVSMAYRNVGTIPAAPVMVRLTFDERMTPVQSTPPWISITDTSLVFEITEVGVGEEGQIVVDMEPDCQNLMLGEVLCYEASITPDTLCDPMLASWDGASLQASYFCEGDSIAFRIENTGDGAMAVPKPYQLNIVNDDIVLLEVGSVQLGAGEADTLYALADTESFLLEIEQPDGHPNPEPVSLLTEGCLSPIDTSLLNDFPGSNGDGFVVERCRAVVGPYDPNIKVAVPEGYGEYNFIAADQPIQYTIHFQNVGTDKARTVTILDELSDQLDLSTFQAGPASHEHEWIILPDRTLNITFPDINLPDSTSNEAESHGFFSFTVQPVDGILPFTSIENEAAIYFDFNPPIITNRTWHLIEKPSVAEAYYVTLCPGDIYLDVAVEQDTIFKEWYEMPEQDSIIWHHINVLTVEDTTEVFVTLDEPGEWQGIDISQDTIITETLMSALGCDSIVSYQVAIVSGLDNPLWAQHILLAPNPARERVKLSWQGLPATGGSVRIYQALGQVVAEQRINSGSQSCQWDVQGWPSGIYWVEMNLAGQLARWRLMVE